MKKVLFSLLCVCVLNTVSFAQRADLQKIREERDQKISEITAEVRDIEARYWAKSVINKTTTMGELENSSKNWLGAPQEHARLLGLIREYVANGNTHITAQEYELLDENRRRVREFLNNGKENPAARILAERNQEISRISQPVADIEARYWAWRIAKVKDITFEEFASNAQKWVGERGTNQLLIEKVEENLKSGNTAALTKKEQKKLEKSKQAVKKLFK